MRQLSSRAGRLILVVCAVIASTACSTGGAPPRARESVVRIDEKDFRITVRPKHVAAGNIRLEVTNDGPVTHELIIVRGLRHLPLRGDGLTVDEDALHADGTIEGAGSGSVRSLRLHLSPGRYQLFCNMAGHYLGGMHAELVVG